MDNSWVIAKKLSADSATNSTSTDEYCTSIRIPVEYGFLNQPYLERSLIVGSLAPSMMAGRFYSLNPLVSIVLALLAATTAFTTQAATLRAPTGGERD